MNGRCAVPGLVHSGQEYYFARFPGPSDGVHRHKFMLWSQNGKICTL